MNTKQLITALKKHYSVKSDYALAGETGLSRAYFSECQKNRRYFSDEMVMKVCKTLKIDPVESLLDVHIEKTESPELKKAWKGIASKFAAVASLCFMMVLSPYSIDSAEANNHTNNIDNIYYVKYERLPQIIRYFLLFIGLHLFPIKRATY